MRRASGSLHLWLGLLVTAYELLRPARCAEQGGQAERQRDNRTSKLIQVLHAWIASRVFPGNGSEIMDPVDDVRERGQNEKQSEEHESEGVEIGQRKATDGDGGTT